MRLHARDVAPTVRTDRTARRPVILHLARLTFTMTTAEARALADQLHDAADRSEP